MSFTAMLCMVYMYQAAAMLDQAADMWRHLMSDYVRMHKVTRHKIVVCAVIKQDNTSARTAEYQADLSKCCMLESCTHQTTKHQVP